MKKGYKLGNILLFLVLFLSGCMYPEDRNKETETSNKNQVQSVQEAVLEFQKDNGGILPIKTSEEATPVYQKYIVDFNKIVPKFLSEPPSNAFESGGIFQYVIVNAEKTPTVKIFDLRIAEVITELKLRIKTQGYPPFKEKISENVFILNYNKLGYKEAPFVVSPFSRNKLPLVINGEGEVFVDYRKDLVQKLRTKEYSFKSGEDIRKILTADSLFVPAYSLPYTIDEKTNEPIFHLK